MLNKTINGFSLFELIIVLSIISILASIAYPIYTQAVVKARRAEAKVALIRLANLMEIYYLENHNSYADASLKKLGINEKTDKNFYQLAVSSTSAAYKLTATATFSDPECQSFFLNERGEKNNSGNASSCW